MAIVEAALTQGGLDQVHLIVSRDPLGKTPSVPTFEHRIEVLEAVASSRPWLEVRVTPHRLIADVAAGYEAVIMGADKWRQVVDPVWYSGSVAARDRAVTSLPRVLIVGRGDDLMPGGLPPGALVLSVGERHRVVSSSAVRAGNAGWMAPEAAAFDDRTGAWSNPSSYAEWLTHEALPGGSPD